LVGLDGDTFAVKYDFDNSDSLPGTNVFGVQLDNHGDLWMSSHQGLIRLGDKRKQLTRFTRQDGLSTHDFNGGYGVNPSTKLSDGQLVFTSALGVTIFDPQALHNDQQFNDGTRITHINLLSKPLKLPLKMLNNSELELNHNDIGLQINYSNLNFGTNEQSRYQATLWGEKAVKYPETTNHSIILPQLKPGIYTFSVVASAAHNTAAASLKITVLPPYWQTRWAYTLYAILILGGVLVFRHAQQQKTINQQIINRELEQKVTDRTRALKQSNQRISTLIDICTEINSTLDPHELIETTCHRIGELMDVDVFLVGQYQPDKQGIFFDQAAECNQYLAELFIPMTEKSDPAVWCIRHRQPMIINEYSRDYFRYFGYMPAEHPTSETTNKAQPQSMIYWPLIVGDHTIGVLSVQSFSHNAYNKHQQNIIQTLAATMAIALDNAHAYHEVESKNREIIATQQQLVQAEKMASLGILTAGVAHEINNPTNFVHVSAQNLKVDLSRFQQFLVELAGDDADQAIVESFSQRFKPLYEHLNTIEDGTERIKIIVQDLRAFSQLDAADKKAVFITDLLQSTVHLIKTKYFEVAEFVCDFTVRPELTCYPAQLNQVFMNLIINACDAIRDQQRRHKNKIRGQVTISCRRFEQVIEISVKDNGCGMTDLTKSKLYEPFYTTKDVGEGTGLGLSISYGIIQQHEGELIVESKLGVGSTFKLLLPLS
jgi:signal transduction histidine kinase